MVTLFNLIINILDWVNYFLLAYIIFSWLYALGLLRNAPQFVHDIASFIYNFIEPVLAFIRNKLPFVTSGTLDFSPVVLYLFIWICKSLLYEYGSRLLFS